MTAREDEKLKKKMRLTVTGQDTTMTSFNMENVNWIEELTRYNKVYSLQEVFKI